MSLGRKALALFAGMGAFVSLSAAAQAADYQRYLNGTCAVNAVCNIDFPNVPAGKTLTVSNLSCYLRFIADRTIYGAQLLLVNNGTGAIAMAVTPSLYAQNGVATSGTTIENVYVSNDTIKAVAVQGQHFRAYAEVHASSTGAVATVSQYACHISGTLLP